MKQEILITNELDIKTTLTLKGQGIRFICKDLLGRNVYAATQRAMDKLIAKHSCAYENGSGETVAAQ